MDASVKLVTVDTNLYQDKQLIDIGRALPYIHLYSTEVTEAEVGKEVIMGFQTRTAFPWGTRPWGHVEIIKNRSIPAIFTVGISKIGSNDVIPRDDTGSDLLAEILRIATNGSYHYPSDLSKMSPGQKRQYNDALILQAHINCGHNILVSNDYKFFGRDKNDTRRVLLEKLCKTSIMSGEEFIDLYGKHLNRQSQK